MSQLDVLYHPRWQSSRRVAIQDGSIMCACRRCVEVSNDTRTSQLKRSPTSNWLEKFFRPVPTCRSPRLSNTLVPLCRGISVKSRTSRLASSRSANKLFGSAKATFWSNARVPFELRMRFYKAIVVNILLWGWLRKLGDTVEGGPSPPSLPVSLSPCYVFSRST